MAGLIVPGKGNRDNVAVNPRVCEPNHEEPGQDNVVGLKLVFSNLSRKLEELRIEANGTVCLEVSLSTKSGKIYEVVLTWGGYSDFHQLHSEWLLHEILSGTHWKISKMLEARNGAIVDAEWEKSPMASAEGKKSRSYISDLKLKLKNRDKTLKEKLQNLNKILQKLRTEAKGAVRMKMPLPAMVHKEDFKNNEEVLTWDDGSECERHGIFSGTKWKISEKINLPHVPNGANEHGELGNDNPTQSTE